MRNDNVLILGFARGAQRSRIRIASNKCQTMGRMSIEERGRAVGLIHGGASLRQVRYLSQILICLDKAWCTHFKMLAIFLFALEERVFLTKKCKIHMSLNVLYSPPYFDVVMQEFCIRKSKVSSQCCSTRFMGDACLNKIVVKSFHVHKAFLCYFRPYGLP